MLAVGVVAATLGYTGYGLAASQEGEDQSMEQQLKAAQDLAKKAGATAPALPKEFTDQLKAEDAASAAATKKASASDEKATVLPLTSPPEWCPALPDFKPVGKNSRKQANGEETGTLKGTCGATPEAIADKWHEMATARKMSFEQQDSNINGKKSIRVRISDLNATMGEATLDLTPGKTTGVELSYKQPRPAAAPTP